MLTTNQILRILQESALIYNHDINMADLQSREMSNRRYDGDELHEFKRDLIETGNNVRILLLEYSLPVNDFHEFVRDLEFPILVFKRTADQIIPCLIHQSKNATRLLAFNEHETIDYPFDQDDLKEYINDQNEVGLLAIMEYDHLVSEADTDEFGKPLEMSPVRRLFKLLKAEKKDIRYVFFYAIIIGLISLVIPLGIQTTTELISGGVFFSSIYILIGLIILGVLVTGVLQIFQLSIVEHL